ncbi:Cation/H(+) antiporter 20 [Vitis vinifera]|uniref:Cation/H(+) antiporter 20 n=1 Tax=Vitis vinifera TaxID=29760 RepID=A0A438HSH4_VITVI|nr:Cation/H(+) antiporter 20 [Vitis vinifera]
MTVNITSISTSSNGVWQGDNPLDFAFPLLIVQTTLILALSRFLAFLLKPSVNPKSLQRLLYAGGILLGPSALGRNQNYLHRIFPSWSTPILESVASIGLLFFLFLVGLELDLSSIRRSGRKALSIATVGITLPFVCGVGVAFVLRKSVDGADKAGYGTFLVFMGVALSITAFPVLARILAELKLLTTRVGETAMAAAAFNDVVAWILLALAVALAGDGEGGEHKSPLISVWVLLSGVAFVIFMMVVIKPAMSWVARRSPDSHSVDEAYICLTLAGVMVSGFVTDLIGIHSIFGAFVFGLTIPKGGGFSERLIERIEDFVTGLLLPLYFAQDCRNLRGGHDVYDSRKGIPHAGCVDEYQRLSPQRRDLCNSSPYGIIHHLHETTPIVMTIYKPVRGGPARTHRRLRDFSSVDSSKYDLRILACVHGPGNVPSLISLIEATRSAKKSQLKLYVMRLVELTERSSSIIMSNVPHAPKEWVPFINRFRRGQSERPS